MVPYSRNRTHNMNNDHLRAMTLFEKQLFARFLSQPFSGSQEIAEQISAAFVRTSDQDGSLEIQSTSPALATVWRKPERTAGPEKEAVQRRTGLLVPPERLGSE